MVELNQAVAIAMADGPAAGLKLVEALEASGALAGYQQRCGVAARLPRAEVVAAARLCVSAAAAIASGERLGGLA